MKIEKIEKVIGLDKDDIVNICYALDDVEELYFTEVPDKYGSAANVISAGFEAYVATDEDDERYGELARGLNKFGDRMYKVDVETIITGVNHALTGDFNAYGNASLKAEAKMAAEHFIHDEQESMFDAGDAYILWQVILFNEIIYG